MHSCHRPVLATTVSESPTREIEQGPLCFLHGLMQQLPGLLNYKFIEVQLNIPFFDKLKPHFSAWAPHGKGGRCTDSRTPIMVESSGPCKLRPIWCWPTYYFTSCPPTSSPNLAFPPIVTSLKPPSCLSVWL